MWSLCQHDKKVTCYPVCQNNNINDYNYSRVEEGGQKRMLRPKIPTQNGDCQKSFNTTPTPAYKVFLQIILLLYIPI